MHCCTPHQRSLTVLYVRRGWVGSRGSVWRRTVLFTKVSSKLFTCMGEGVTEYVFMFGREACCVCVCACVCTNVMCACVNVCTYVRFVCVMSYGSINSQAQFQRKTVPQLLRHHLSERWRDQTWQLQVHITNRVTKDIQYLSTTWPQYMREIPTKLYCCIHHTTHNAYAATVSWEWYKRSQESSQLIKVKTWMSALSPTHFVGYFQHHQRTLLSLH